MSYSIKVILTNGRKVQEIEGSKNNEFLNIIPEEEYDEIDFLLEDHFDLSTGELSSKALMKNLIDSDYTNLYTHLRQGEYAEKYGENILGSAYAYLEAEVCNYFGKEINRNADGWPMFGQYLSDFEPQQRSYFAYKKPLDFPHTFFTFSPEFPTYYEKWKSNLEKSFPGNGEMQDDLKYIFEKANEEKLNIFLFNS